MIFYRKILLLIPFIDMSTSTEIDVENTSEEYTTLQTVTVDPTYREKLRPAAKKLKLSEIHEVQCYEEPDEIFPKEKVTTDEEGFF